jgi:hypothetical protein
MKMVTKVKTHGSWAIQDVTYHEIHEELTIHMQEGTKGQGKKLVYSHVPKSVFEEFLKAESKGKFYNSRIRNSYPFLGEI